LDSGFGGDDGGCGRVHRLQSSVVAASHGGIRAEDMSAFRSPEIENRRRRKELAARCNHGIWETRIENQRKRIIIIKKKLR